MPIKHSYGKSLFTLFLIIGCIFFINLTPHNAYAADECTAVGGLSMNNGSDTDDFKVTNLSIITEIIQNIQGRLLLVSGVMYNYINNPITGFSFLTAVQGAMVLFIAFYGIAFMTGMVQLKFYDFAIRMIKFGIVAELLSPTSWLFFNDYVIKFFNGGTDDIINFMTGANGLFSNIPIAGGIMNGTGPFSALDGIISKVVSAKMFVTILATFMTKYYGWFYGILLLMAIWSLLKAVMNAMWVYIMSLVIKTLLFGLAPIFIPTILFQRTRHIFDGWLNQIISASLQPILLFMFFAFFIKLMEGSLDNIMRTPICFSRFPEGWRGSGLDFSFWRFMEHTSNGWEPKVDGAEINNKFPVSLMAVLTFLIIAELANRFNTVVMHIAMQIAQAQTALTGIEGPISAMAGSARSAFSKTSLGSGVQQGGKNFGQ